MNDRLLDDERIFHTARLLPSSDAIADYLDQVCGGDQALRERIEEFLKVHHAAQSFLKSNDQQVAAMVDLTPSTERPARPSAETS